MKLTISDHPFEISMMAQENQDGIRLPYETDVQDLNKLYRNKHKKTDDRIVSYNKWKLYLLPLVVLLFAIFYKLWY